jgi:hypothetical protein
MHKVVNRHNIQTSIKLRKIHSKTKLDWLIVSLNIEAIIIYSSLFYVSAHVEVDLVFVRADCIMFIIIVSSG